MYVAILVPCESCLNMVAAGINTVKPVNNIHETHDLHNVRRGSAQYGAAFRHSNRSRSEFDLPHLHLAPRRGWPVRISKRFLHQKTRVPGLSCGIVCVFLRLAILEEHRLVTDRQAHTHKQTDRRTHDHGIYRAEHSSRGKKIQKWAYMKVKVYRRNSTRYIKIQTLRNMHNAHS